MSSVFENVGQATLAQASHQSCTCTYRRICIWTADTRPSAPAAELSPHPLKLSQTIITGHRANIFSARFLPNSGTPTVVSCAGDDDIRVFEIERLQPADGMDLRVRRARGALWGVEGPG